jgi:hypothetical protein
MRAYVLQTLKAAAQVGVHKHALVAGSHKVNSVKSDTETSAADSWKETNGVNLLNHLLTTFSAVMHSSHRVLLGSATFLR